MSRKRPSKPSRKPRSRSSRKGSNIKSSVPTLLGPEKLKQLYSTMFQCRMLVERVRVLFDQGHLPGSHRAVTGREATEVGAIIDLSAEDCIAPRQLDVVAGFIQKVPLKQIFTQLFAESAGGAVPQPASPALHVIADISSAAARLSIATGAALAYKIQKKPNVVVAFSGNDSAALGSWQETIDFAIRHKLPIVHLVQDDLGSESISTKSSSKPSQRGGHIPTFMVDGNDVVAVYRVVYESVRRARQGYGPTLIDCKSHRWPGSSIIPGMLPASENEVHTPADPIAHMEGYLQGKGLWSDAWKERLTKTFKEQLDSAVRFAERKGATNSVSHEPAKSEIIEYTSQTPVGS